MDFLELFRKLKSWTKWYAFEVIQLEKKKQKLDLAVELVIDDSLLVSRITGRLIHPGRYTRNHNLAVALTTRNLHHQRFREKMILPESL